MTSPAPRPPTRSLTDDPVAFAFRLWSDLAGAEPPFEDAFEADYAAITALVAAVAQQAPETEPLLTRIAEAVLTVAGTHHHRGISFGVRAEALRLALRPETTQTWKQP